MTDNMPDARDILIAHTITILLIFSLLVFA